ncbi:MAG: hypothetical protein ACI9CD_000421 [Candidatus Deianiraeaceae bacterium]|jgi:hypothetical protein
MRYQIFYHPDIEEDLFTPFDNKVTSAFDTHNAQSLLTMGYIPTRGDTKCIQNLLKVGKLRDMHIAKDGNVFVYKSQDVETVAYSVIVQNMSLLRPLSALSLHKVDFTKVSLPEHYKGHLRNAAMRDNRSIGDVVDGVFSKKEKNIGKESAITM